MNNGKSSSPPTVLIETVGSLGCGFNFPETNHGDPDVLLIAKRFSAGQHRHHLRHHRPDLLRLGGAGVGGVSKFFLTIGVDNHEAAVSSPDLLSASNSVNSEFSPSQRQSLMQKLSASYDRECSDSLPIDHCGSNEVSPGAIGASDCNVIGQLKLGNVPIETSRWSLCDETVSSESPSFDEEDVLSDSDQSSAEPAQAPCSRMLFCDNRAGTVETYTSKFTCAADSMPNLPITNSSRNNISNQKTANDHAIFQHEENSDFTLAAKRLDPSSCLNLAFFAYS